MRKGSMLCVAIAIGLILTAYSMPLTFAWAQTKPTVIFMFDDGYESTYTEAYPAFKNRKLKADFDLLTGKMNSTFETIATMTWAQAKTLRLAGWGVHSHGYTGENINELSSAELTQEINASKRYIYGNLSVYPSFYVYSGASGITNATVVEKIRVEYFAHRVVNYLITGSGTSYKENSTKIWFDPMKVNLFGNTIEDVPVFYDICTTANNLTLTAETVAKALIDNVIANGSKTTVVGILFHHITNSPRAYPYCDTTLGNLTNILDYAIDKVDDDKLSISTLGSAFAQRKTQASLDVIIAVAVTLAMLSVVLGMLRKFTTQRG